MILRERARAVLALATRVYQGTEHHPRLAEVARRLDEPLRVAVAGRVKAGKSTLLNALVGERLAATDAGECTRIVTWYTDGHTYRVTAHPAGGPPRQLRFGRGESAIEVDLDGLAPEQVARLVVTWPSRTLRTATLIDTPGIGSLSEAISRRSWDLVTAEDQDSPADAVLYLLRHVHAADLDFLRAFHDTGVSQPDPVNAIGVLSRADEVAVGRLDAMTAAGRVATRMAGDPAVRRLVQTVVPVAGLLAETAATLTETEVAQLRRIAGLPARAAEALLLTADRFVDRLPELGLTSLEREALLGRFGLFGLRLTTTMLRHRAATTATDLSARLAERSGIGALREVLGSLFFERRDVLKSRAALLAVESVLRTSPRPGSEAVASELEQVVASAHPFQELRVLAAIRSGQVGGEPELLAALERVIGGAGGAAHTRLDLPATAEPAELATAATEALLRWQRLAEHPLTTHALATAARVAVRSCEGMLAAPAPR